MKKDRILNLVIFLLIAGLIYLLYRVSGGDLTVWFKAGENGSAVDNFFGGVLNGMHGVTDGIGNVFGRLKP